LNRVRVPPSASSLLGFNEESPRGSRRPEALSDGRFSKKKKIKKRKKKRKKKEGKKGKKTSGIGSLDYLQPGRVMTREESRIINLDGWRGKGGRGGETPPE
jgi:hypothetical protein